MNVLVDVIFFTLQIKLAHKRHQGAKRFTIK